ncbi:MAG: glycoside hydrolase family 25 protein [Raoultibacter sp.]
MCFSRLYKFSLRVLLVCALGLPLTLLASCAEDQAVESHIELYKSPYNFEGLVYENDRYTYTENGVLQSKIGIDVSEHQGVIDWNAVAADGIEFAFIRLGNRGATEGVIGLDEQYQANLEGAVAAGIPVGVYFFSQSINAAEAIEEADFVLANLQGAALQYPIVYDHEPVSGIANPRANDLSKEQATENAQAFCNRIKEAGYESMLYGNKSDIARFDQSIRDTNDIWFAEYDTSTPTGRFDFSIWQYSNNGTVAGIPARVDMNIEFLTAPKPGASS